MSKIHIATYQRVIHNGVSVAEHLKKDLPDFGKSVVVRLGGTMPYQNYEIQINSAEAVKNSVNKLKQKELLQQAGIPVLPTLQRPVYPCVLKGVVRSGGTSVFVVRSDEDFTAVKLKLGEYYIEPLFDTTSEYRLHCTQEKVFFAVKKHKRNPDDIIVTRDNHFNKREFVKPRLWQQINDACIKAMKALNLDIACFDVLYCSRDNNNHKFVISEANTNPELLHNTYLAYLATIEELVRKKIKEKANNNQPVIKPVKEEAKGNKLSEVKVLEAINILMAGDYEYNKEKGTITIKL